MGKIKILAFLLSLWEYNELLQYINFLCYKWTVNFCQQVQNKCSVISTPWLEGVTDRWKSKLLMAAPCEAATYREIFNVICNLFPVYTGFMTLLNDATIQIISRICQEGRQKWSKGVIKAYFAANHLPFKNFVGEKQKSSTLYIKI